MSKDTPKQVLKRILERLSGLPDPYHRAFAPPAITPPAIDANEAARNLLGELGRLSQPTRQTEVEVYNSDLRRLAHRLQISIDDEIASVEFEIFLLNRALQDIDDGIKRLEAAYRDYVDNTYLSPRSDVLDLVEKDVRRLGRLTVSEDDGKFTLSVPGFYQEYLANQVAGYFDQYAKATSEAQAKEDARWLASKAEMNAQISKFRREYFSLTGIENPSTPDPRIESQKVRRRNALSNTIKYAKFTRIPWQPAFIAMKPNLKEWVNGLQRTLFSLVKETRTIAMQAVLPLTVLGGLVATMMYQDNTMMYQGNKGNEFGAQLKGAVPFILAVALPLGLYLWWVRQSQQREAGVLALRDECKTLLLRAIEQLQLDVKDIEALHMADAITQLKGRREERKEQHSQKIKQREMMRDEFKAAAKQLITMQQKSKELT